MTDRGPWRTGMPRPRPSLPLPPDAMPVLRGGRPLKRWRWVGAFCDEVMLCAAVARVGPLGLSWWAVWDREQRTLAERISRGRPAVAFDGERVLVDDGPVRIELELDDRGEAVETVSPHGGQYAWTRKRGGVAVRGSVAVGERRHAIDARAIVDDSAGYHARATAWRWAAGVGTSEEGRLVAWNLVTGLHDARDASERTVWVDGVAHEVGPVAFEGSHAVAFAEGGRVSFDAEVARSHEAHLVVLASAYEQPFGSFAGELPHAGRLREGLGVMERHEARW